MVPRQAVAPENLLEMQILQPHPRPTESEKMGEGPTFSLWMTLRFARVWEPLGLTTNPANTHWAHTVLGAGLRTLWSESERCSVDSLWRHGLYSENSIENSTETIQSMEFSRPENWSEQLFPSPGDLSNPGIESRSPTLQADSLPAEPQGKPTHKGRTFFHDCVVNPHNSPSQG